MEGEQNTYQLKPEEQRALMQMRANVAVAKEKVYDLNVEKETLSGKIQDAIRDLMFEQRKYEGAINLLLLQQGMQQAEFAADFSRVTEKAQ